METNILKDIDYRMAKCCVSCQLSSILGDKVLCNILDDFEVEPVFICNDYQGLNDN